MTHSLLEQQLFERLKIDGLVRTNDDADNPLLIRSSAGEKLNWLFDMRCLLTQSDDMDLMATVFWERMKESWPFQIGGLEVGAIPLVAAIVMKGREHGYKVNSFIVRKSRKKSGLCKQIEGKLTQEPIVVVDDLINSGNSMRRVVAALEEEEKTIDTVFTYLNFGRESAAEYLEEQNIKFEWIYHLSEFDLQLNTPVEYFPETQNLTVDWAFLPPYPNLTFSVPHSRPVFDDDKLYYGADNGWFYAVDKSSGQEAWSFQTGESLKGIFSSPALTDQGVIFGAYDGSIYHLNRADGSVLWESALADYVGSSPCLVPDLGLGFIGLEHNVHDNRGSLVAFNLETGEKVWEYFTREYMHSSPAYWAEERLVTVGCNDGKVLLLNAKNGSLEWEFMMKGPLKAAPTFDPIRRQVIAPSFDNHCYGIDIDTGEEKWNFKAGHAFYTTALVHEDRVYVGGCDKYFYIYDLEQNKLVKRLPTTGRILSDARVINGSVWFGANDGGIRQIDHEGNYLGGIYLPERPLTAVVYDERMDRYFVVTAGNHLLSMKPVK